MKNSLLRAAAIVIATLMLAATASARTPLPINNDACLSGSGQAGIAACTELTNAIGRDLHRLNANARALENLGRHESATHLYAAAAAYFPDDKRALQGLVRSRANARARRLIADIAPLASDTSPCWTLRWMQAFEACRREVQTNPNDARLQERFGDVARSVGNARQAQAAYASSLALQPDNDNLHRKRDALVRLLHGGTEAPGAEAPQPVQVAASEAPPESTEPDPDAATVRQLELLEKLKEKRLIAASEYEKRRSVLLASAFGDLPADDRVVRYRGLANGRYLAVVIGNDDYTDYPQLQTAAADAAAVSEVLRTRYGFEVTTLLNADRYQILTALSDLRQRATVDDNVLLYYAGHGLLDADAGQGYWLPVDAERGNFAQWISTGDIAAVLTGAAAQHALVIADSCFAGTLLRAGDGTGFETLQRLASKRSRLVLTSGGLEPVVDDGDGRHSVFAGALLDVLRSNTSVLEASRLFASVRDYVVQNADQTPQFAPMRAARHDGGDFLFIPETIR